MIRPRLLEYLCQEIFTMAYLTTLTDFPNTRNLNKLFMNVIAAIKGLKNKAVTDKIEEIIVANSSDDATFKAKLEGLFIRQTQTAQDSFSAIMKISIRQRRSILTFGKEIKEINSSGPLNIFSPKVKTFQKIGSNDCRRRRKARL